MLHKKSSRSVSRVLYPVQDGASVIYLGTDVTTCL